MKWRNGIFRKIYDIGFRVLMPISIGDIQTVKTFFDKRASSNVISDTSVLENRMPEGSSVLTPN